MNKKCVLFCPSDVWGGVEKNVALRASFLIKKGYDVSVVILKNHFRERYEKIAGLQIINVNSRGGDVNIAVVVNYVNILKKIKPKAVFVASKKDWFLVSLAAKIAKVPRTILYLGIKRKIKNSIKYRFVFNKLKPIVLVNSNSLKEYLLASTPFFNNKNLFRIYNGFTTNYMDASMLNIKKRLGLSEDSLIIGCAGRLSPMKGYDLLPLILEKLPDNYHVVHVGKGTEEDEKELKGGICKTSCKDRIHFLGHLHNIHPFFNEIDVFLLCSRNEGMANVLNEALSHGVAVVSTKAPGSEELLDGGTYGVLTEIDDVEAMANGIYKIITKELAFSSETAKKWIQESFSMKLMEERTEELFFRTPQKLN